MLVRSGLKHIFTLIFISVVIFSKAAVFTVLNGNNSGSGSLRTVLELAGNNDIIQFLGPFSVQLQSTIVIDKPVTIIGNSNRIVRASGSIGFVMFRLNNFSANPGIVHLQNLIFDGGDILEGIAMVNNRPNVEITRCLFERNHGQGLVSNLASGQITVRRTVFQNNVGSLATAFRNIAGNVSLEECDFQGNRSSGSGVAILIEAGQVSITRSTIRGNSASTGAGLSASNASITMVNSIITGNRSAASGTGINLGGNASLTVHSSTIAGNAATSGGAVYLGNTSSLTMTNSICWGNSAAIQAEAGTSSQITYSIIQGGFAGTGNLNVDPLFVSPGSLLNSNPDIGGSYQLQTCSPAINAGSLTNAPAIDLLGEARPKFGNFDMGAYESATIGSTGIAYVLATANGSRDGSSWGNAFNNLQAALAFARSCPQVREVWVAKGTYTPALTSGNRDSAFILINEVAIYGGFAGTETQLSQRNWRLNPTILSGDIGVVGNRDDNSYNVIANDNNGLNATAILDGFIIRDGQANKTTQYGRMRGGGMMNYFSSPLVRNCIFTGNFASVYGGAVFNQGESATPTFINCVFSGNQALFGGGIYNESAQTRVINCTFSSNLVANTGGGLYSYGQPLAVVRNSIVWGNTNGITTAPIDNSTSIEVTHSIVQGGYAGTGNLSVDPLFAGPAAIGLGQLGNLRLLTCSPALNSGSNAALPAGVTTDIAGFTRIVFGTVDCGAYELNHEATLDVYVDAAATGSRDGTSWANAFSSLQAALSDMNVCSAGFALTMHIAAGTYDFPVNTPAIVDNLNGEILGGYPTGGGNRDAAVHPVVIRGEVRVLKNIKIDGVRVAPPQ